jgi:hypothetical protein
MACHTQYEYNKKHERGMVMSNLKKITLLLGLITLTISFQLIPVIFSHQYVLLAMFSAFPIYLITRISGPMGLIAFMAAGIGIFSISPHEGLFFLFTNGPIGLVVGLGMYLGKKSLGTLLIMSIILTITLSLLNFVLGIKVFGADIPGLLGMEVIFIFLFSLLYSTLFSYTAELIYKFIWLKNNHAFPFTF